MYIIPIIFWFVQIADVIRTFMLHTDLFWKLQRHASPDDRIKEVIHHPMLEWHGSLGNLVKRLNRAMLTSRMGTEDISKWRLYYDTAVPSPLSTVSIGFARTVGARSTYG